MNDKQQSRWERSREAYVQYRTAKRNLRACYRAFMRTDKRLRNATQKYLEAISESHKKITDTSQPYKIANALQQLQNANSEHDAARTAMTEAVKDIQDAEIAYSVVLFNGLRKDHNLSLSDIGRIYGIYPTTLSDWIRNEDKGDMIDIYREEYGSDDIDEDE